MADAALLQGTYYVLTGPASFVSRRAFEAVTGPKTDWWLVNTVGGLVTVIGASLLAARSRRRVTPELRAVGAGAAAVLAGIDVYYVARRRIPPVYLADAALQAACLAAWRDRPRAAAPGACFRGAPRGRG